MISPIGNSYSYYTSSYASGATIGAARTAMSNTLHDDWLSVPPVDDVPEVASNTETERVERTPEELQQDRRDAYEIMNSLNPRNAEHLNAPLEFMTKSPFNAEITDITKSTKGTENPEECETCEKRTYVDGSNESDVSFKTPGHISPEASASVVSAHEYEHVRNAMQEDKKENVELVNTSVSLKTAICPECGTSYVAGGETRTTMRYGAEQNAYEKQQQAYENYISGSNGQLNIAA